MSRILIYTPFLIIALAAAYSIFSMVGSQKRVQRPVRQQRPLHFVFLVPCLDEATVIGNTVERLLALEGPSRSILVIDDGSSDGTAAIVEDFDHPAVHVLRRVLPNARQGKGEALNAGVRHLQSSTILGDWVPDDVVVCVVDADGRLDPMTLREVAPMYSDPQVAGVQIGVRMLNAGDNLLARMQDVEFVAYSEIFQRSRSGRGIAGLGGNGQFTRLVALFELGADPWTKSLTEDLDLGLRLVSLGWKTQFCGVVAVHQQALTNVGRLVRQRTRWFQGHLQAAARIPMLAKSNLSFGQACELSLLLMLPIVVVGMSLFGIAVWSAAVVRALVTWRRSGVHLGASTVWRGLVMYLLTFGTSYFYGFVYWLHSSPRKIGLVIRDSHVMVLYQYIWLFAGAKALWRAAFQQNDWAKTARLPDAVPAAPSDRASAPAGSPHR